MLLCVWNHKGCACPRRRRTPSTPRRLRARGGTRRWNRSAAVRAQASRRSPSGSPHHPAPPHPCRARTPSSTQHARRSGSRSPAATPRHHPRRLAVVREAEQLAVLGGGDGALDAGDLAQPQVRFHTGQAPAVEALCRACQCARVRHRGEQVGDKLLRRTLFEAAHDNLAEHLREQRG